MKPVYGHVECRIDGSAAKPGPHGNRVTANICQRRPQKLHPMEGVFFKGASRRHYLHRRLQWPQPEVGRYQINTRRGMRWSAADAYCASINAQTSAQKPRPASVALFEGRKAIGVACELVMQNAVRARRAAAQGQCSPQLLRPPASARVIYCSNTAFPSSGQRRRAGTCRTTAMSYYYMANSPTLNNVLSSWWGKLRIVCNTSPAWWPLEHQRQPVSGFVQSHADTTQADLQLYCNPSPTRWRPQPGYSNRARPVCRLHSLLPTLPPLAVAALISPVLTFALHPTSARLPLPPRRCGGIARRAPDPAWVKHRPCKT